MTNQGSYDITPGTYSQSIPEGYHNGNGTVDGDSNLKADNIRDGVSIFGVTGGLEPASEAVDSGSITTSSNIITVSGLDFEPSVAVVKRDGGSGDYWSFVFYVPSTSGDKKGGTIRSYYMAQDFGGVETGSGTMNLDGFEVEIPDMSESHTWYWWAYR